VWTCEVLRLCQCYDAKAGATALKGALAWCKISQASLWSRDHGWFSLYGHGLGLPGIPDSDSLQLAVECVHGVHLVCRFAINVCLACVQINQGWARGLRQRTAAGPLSHGHEHGTARARQQTKFPLETARARAPMHPMVSPDHVPQLRQPLAHELCDSARSSPSPPGLFTWMVSGWDSCPSSLGLPASCASFFSEV
jgi:hypothetical protein